MRGCEQISLHNNISVELFIIMAEYMSSVNQREQQQQYYQQKWRLQAKTNIS